jgi:bifunctional enzyme CysN/CysC
MPVQDIYKFTEQHDDRRIVAGTILTGSVTVGDEVVFYPSRKESRVKSIEGFNTPVRKDIGAPYAAGVTLATQIYIKPGEIMCKKGEPHPHVGRRFRVNIFWMGRPPMVKNKRYKLKVGAMAVQAELAEVIQVLDASELSTVENKDQIDRHDVAEVILETVRPVAFDLRNDLEPTGRIVIVDDYEIAGAAVILQPLGEERSVMQAHIADREYHWERGLVPATARAEQSKNIGKLIILHGIYGCGKRRVAKQLEKQLFDAGHRTYYFGISNYFEELDHDARTRNWGREQHLQRLGELARVITDAGVLLITTVTDADDYDMARLRELNTPTDIFVIHMGEDNPFGSFKPDIHLPYRPEMDHAVNTIIDALKAKGIVLV